MAWRGLFGRAAPTRATGGAGSEDGPLLTGPRRESLAVPSGLVGGGSDSEADLAQRRMRKNPM
jgi:hypothetical protein